MNYFIITFSKVHHQITEAQKTKLMEMETNQIELSDGSVIKVNSISEILPEDKYYQACPDKRPEKTRQEFSYPKEGNQQIRKPTKRAKELMKQGFIKYHLEWDRALEQAEQKFKEFRMLK